MCDSNYSQNEKRKRKRIKLECFSCGSTFDDDYRRKHEKNIHNCMKVKVKHASASSQNPFEVAARLALKRKVRKYFIFNTENYTLISSVN